MEDLPRAADEVVLNAPPPSVDTEPEEETTMKTEPTDESEITVKLESTDPPVKSEPTDVKIEKTEEEEEEEEEDTQPSFLSSRSNSISQRILTPEEEVKVRAIAAACEAGDREKVVEAAITKDGLICDRVRREACKLSHSMATRRVWSFMSLVLLRRQRTERGGLRRVLSGVLSFKELY
jgi:hypothetical protein